MSERNEEFARIREYLQVQASQRTTEELIQRVQEAAAELAVAARAIPAETYGRTHAGENWSPRECLEHIVGQNAEVAQRVLYVALTGEQPAQQGSLDVPSTRDGALAKQQDALDSLYDHVRGADPAAFLDLKWEHPFFGDLNWREWLLFLRIHCKDHERQLQKMAE